MIGKLDKYLYPKAAIDGIWLEICHLELNASRDVHVCAAVPAAGAGKQALVSLLTLETLSEIRFLFPHSHISALLTFLVPERFLFPGFQPHMLVV